MPKIKGVLLDLDGCLYDYDLCNNYAIDATLSYLSEKLNKDRGELVSFFYSARNDVKKYINGTAASHSRLLYFQRLLESLNLSSDLVMMVELNNLFWDNFLSEMNLYPGVLDFLEHLKSRNIKIAIITDLTAGIQMRKLIKLDILKYIDFLVTSEEAGYDKPHKNIFELALRKLNLSKEEVILIGDNYEKDAVGAREFGIRYILTNMDVFKNGEIKKYF